MSHRCTPRAVARHSLRRTLGCTLSCASALLAIAAAAPTASAASPEHAHSEHARPGHAAAKSGKSSKSSKSAKSTNSAKHATSAKHSASATKHSMTSRSHAHAHAAAARAHERRGRHARHETSREMRLLRTVAESRPAPLAVPVVPVVPAIDLHAPGTASLSAASTLSIAMGAAGAAGDTLAGRSGKLRARFLVPSAAVTATFAGAARSIAGLFPYLRRVFGDTAARVAPGVYEAPVADGRPPFAFITMLPFSEKVAGRIGDYRIGFWPGESARRLTNSYGNPMGFIEVTAVNQATYVSEHFKLGDFLTHDQQDVWPKYLVLHEQLLDKLELVLDDLRSHGYQAERLHVMSGFRTPQYNQTGGDPSGRAELSRHQYGDAADVWVENGSGTMADLNGDGRIDARDAAILAAAADRVEQAHPELVGGVGIYHGNGAHGPFVHIDTRGARARWGHG